MMAVDANGALRVLEARGRLRCESARLNSIDRWFPRAQLWEQRTPKLRENQKEEELTLVGCRYLNVYWRVSSSLASSWQSKLASPV
ncbi:hypothetical protein R1flu_007475 [Riccia fluitans]|uniref:Uncharacterized protein n=1 Tax=Riccia fluitans TaxID=41844 RepID=A0ABD1YZ14_9MARC